VSSVSAIVLAYLDEPWLERSVDALLASQGVEVEIVVVDNGCRPLRSQRSTLRTLRPELSRLFLALDRSPCQPTRATEPITG
jgi:hypothetical protein